MKTKPGSGGPRLDTFDRKRYQDSQSPGDMKVANRLNPGPSVAPNEASGRPDPQVGKPRRGLFSQRYYRPSNQHPDNLHGNPDARREIGEG